HTHLEPARGQEVAQFVERHDEGQAQDELGGLGQDLHAGMRSRTTRRASASVATRAGRSGAASKGRVCNAYSTRSLISRKPIRSSRKSSTATSLAAFSTQGALPPRSIASKARARLRKVARSGGSKVSAPWVARSKRGQLVGTRSG